MEQLSEVYQVRITKTLKTALERRARQLGVRTADIARMALAQAAADTPARATEAQHERQTEPAHA